MNQRDEQTITHIYFHCKEVDDFIERFGDSFESFSQDRAYFNSVCMSIMQISELSRVLSDEYCESTKDKMPWAKVKGIRNIIAHGYSELNEKAMWKTAKEDVPVLKKICKESISIEE